MGCIWVVIVVFVECVIMLEIVEGFGNMSVFVNEEGLKCFDNIDVVDYCCISCLFGENCGFIIGEGV